MGSNEITSFNSSQDLTNIEVVDIKEDNGYIQITLCNGEKILTNGTEVYNVSEYSGFKEIIELNNEKYAVFNIYGHCKIINLNKNECIFDDERVGFIAKVDNSVIKIYKNSKEEPLYNIEKKQYVSMDECYEYESKLREGYYSIVEKDENFEKKFHDRLRMIIDKEGNIIAKRSKRLHLL